MEAVESVLTVVGAISIVIGIIRFFWVITTSGTEWIDNICIEEMPWSEDLDIDEHFASQGKAIYPTVYKSEEDTNAYCFAVYYIIPQNAIIRNLKIKHIDYDSIPTDKLIYRTVRTVKQITPENPLCMIIDRGEAIAQYKIEWKTQYGGKAEYYFYENMRDSAYDKVGIQYSFGVWSKIRKYFGLI